MTKLILNQQSRGRVSSQIIDTKNVETVTAVAQGQVLVTTKTGEQHLGFKATFIKDEN